MRIWDGYSSVDVLSFIFILLILVDAVAMVQVTSSVGHHGKKGCWILCRFSGRNKPIGSHYYPVLLQPLDLDDSDDPDFDINNLPDVDPVAY